MTNKDPGVEYDNSPNVFPFMLEQYTKRLYTAMPGQIVSYDADKRRATVRGSLQVVMHDGELVERPVIINVPVVFQQSLGFLQAFPLVEGDSVLLVFSMRGISRWKMMHAESAPGVDGLMSERDAVAIPGFGPHFDHLPMGGWPPVEIISEDNNYLRLRVKDPTDTTDEVAWRTLEFSPDHIQALFDLDAARRLIEMTADHVRLDFSEMADIRRIESTADHILLDFGEAC